jgi:uncharacterized membrane protein
LNLADVLKNTEIVSMYEVVKGFAMWQRFKAGEQARLLIVGTMALWLLLAWLAPCLAAHGHHDLYAVFRGACHQIAERCFCIYEQPIALCVRCTGIYSGIMLATLLWTKPCQNRKVLLTLLGGSASVMLLDVALETIGVYHNVKWLRFTTGMGFGIALAPILVNALTDMLRESASTKKTAKNLS